VRRFRECIRPCGIEASTGCRPIVLHVARRGAVIALGTRVRSETPRDHLAALLEVEDRIIAMVAALAVRERVKEQSRCADRLHSTKSTFSAWRLKLQVQRTLIIEISISECCTQGDALTIR
jgi:hypothetical protein